MKTGTQKLIRSNHPDASIAAHRVGTLVWLLWRRNRWLLITIASSLIVYRISMDVGGFRLVGVLTGYIGILFCGLAFIGRIANGDVANSLDSEKGNGSAYPAYMLTLPASDLLLTAVPIAFGVISCCLLLCLGACLFPIPHTGIQAWIRPAVSLLAMIICLPTVTWSKVRILYVKVVLATVIIVGAPFALIWDWNGVHGLLGAQLAFPALALALVVPGFGRARHGHPDPIALVGAPKPVKVTKLRRTQPPFNSGVAAQTWLDFRRQAVTLPAFTLVLSTLILFLNYLYTRDSSDAIGQLGNPGRDHDSVPQITIILFFLAAFITSTFPRRTDVINAEGSVLPFLSTRPISSSDLVFNQLRVGLVSLLASATVVASLIAYVMVPRMIQYSEIYHVAWMDFSTRTPADIAFLVTSFAGLVLVVWNAQTCLQASELSGQRWLTIVVSTLYLGMLMFAMIQPSSGDGYSMSHDQVRFVLWLVVLVKFGAALVSANYLLKNRLISATRVVKVSVIWLAVFGAFFSALLWCRQTRLSDTTTVVPGIIIWIPLARYFLAPICLERNRHRA